MQHSTVASPFMQPTLWDPAHYDIEGASTAVDTGTRPGKFGKDALLCDYWVVCD